MRRLALLIALLAFSVATLFGALLAGPFPISALQVLDSVIYPSPGVVHDVIWRMRAPRAAAAFTCGGLAAAGLVGLVSSLRGQGIARSGWVLLLAFLLGGSALTLADTVTRWPEAPWRQVF